MDYDIIHVIDHYEAYLNGEFICSGDTKAEVERDVGKWN